MSISIILVAVVILWATGWLRSLRTVSDTAQSELEHQQFRHTASIMTRESKLAGTVDEGVAKKAAEFRASMRALQQTSEE